MTTAEEYYNEGWAYWNNYDEEEALKCFNNAIKEDSKHSKSYIMRGHYYANMEEYDKALSDYTKAIEVAPDNVESYLARGCFYANQEEYDNAIEDYTKAIEKIPTKKSLDIESDMEYYIHREQVEQKIDIYKRRSKIYIKANKLKNAIADYTNAIEIVSDYAYNDIWAKTIMLTLYLERGDLLKEYGMFDDAINDYTFLVTGDEYDAIDYADSVGKRIDEIKKIITYFKLGNDCLIAEDFHNAIIYLSKGIELNPKNVMGYEERGDCYENIQDYAKAIEDYTKAIELEPHNAKYYSRRGYCFNNLHQLKNGIKDFAKAVELEPNNTLYNETLIKMQELETASNKMKNVTNQQIILTDIKQKFEIGEIEDAIEGYDKLVEANPDSAETYINRGDLCLLYCNNLDIGCRISGIKDALKGLRPLKDKKSDKFIEYIKKAISDYSKAIELEPNNIEAYENRGNAFEICEEYNSAIEDYKKAMELSENPMQIKDLSQKIKDLLPKQNMKTRTKNNDATHNKSTKGRKLDL